MKHVFSYPLLTPWLSGHRGAMLLSSYSSLSSGSYMSGPWQLQFPHLEDGAAKSVSPLQGHWQGHWLRLISVLMELHLPGLIEHPFLTLFYPGNNGLIHTHKHTQKLPIKRYQVSGNYNSNIESQCKIRIPLTNLIYENTRWFSWNQLQSSLSP